MADKDFDLDEFEDMIEALERKNDALVDYLKTIISDAEFLLRKLGER